MDHYIDIKIISGSELSSNVIMNSLFEKIHILLVEVACTSIGISFPLYNKERFSLGDRIRLHGPKQNLDVLFSKNWLFGLKDHVLIGKVEQVPNFSKFCVVRRVQAKSNFERIRRRQMRRHGLSEEESFMITQNNKEQRLDLPFLKLSSASTKQHFRLFINQEVLNEGRGFKNDFNSYGLSSTSSLPYF